MDNQKPIRHDALDAKIIAVLAQYPIRFEETPDCIRDVAIVGGLLSGTALFPADMQRLIDILPLFSKAGIPLHPECRFWTYNRILQSDFLTAATGAPDERKALHPQQIDLVLCSYIFDNIPGSCEYGEIDSATGVSPDHLKKNVWADSAINLGARFAVTCGSIHEVNAAHFIEAGDFEAVIGYQSAHNDDADHFSYTILTGSQTSPGIKAALAALPERSQKPIAAATRLGGIIAVPA